MITYHIICKSDLIWLPILSFAMVSAMPPSVMAVMTVFSFAFSPLCPPARRNPKAEQWSKEMSNAHCV